MIFPPIYVTETRLLTFTFGGELAVGETISSAAVTAAVYSGTDATPSSVISGAASISGTNVTQLISGPGGEVGVTYALTCLAVTSLGQTVALMGYLVIKPAP